MTTHDRTCLLLLALVLTGCERALPLQAEEILAAAPDDAAPAARWSLETGAGEVSLGVEGTEANTLFRIACLPSPARLVVTVTGFAVVPSEERLTLGVSDEAFLLVADVVGRPGNGVRAEAEIPAELLDRFSATRAVSAVYGSATAGPFLPPSPEQSSAFVAACREIAG